MDIICLCFGEELFLPGALKESILELHRCSPGFSEGKSDTGKHHAVPSVVSNSVNVKLACLNTVCIAEAFERSFLVEGEKEHSGHVFSF